MRVIPPPSPRSRSPFPLLAAFRTPPLLLPTALTARAIARTPPPRRPPQQHPLKNRQISPQPLQLSRLFRVRRPQPGVLLTQLSRQPRHLLVRFKGPSQRIPQRCLSTPR